MIPLSRPSITDLDISMVEHALRSGRLSMGSFLTSFETLMAEQAKVRYAVAVNSGSSALQLIVEVLGIGASDEVITTPFSFIASANCIVSNGATPVFVDIDPVSYCLDEEKIETVVTPQTAAILGVDVFGHPCQWERIQKIAQRYDLSVIEDACEAIGSTYAGRPCGSFGDAACYSFYPNKAMTMGEGGVILTNDQELAERCQMLRNQGRTPGSGHLEHQIIGYNYRLGEMNCALGVSQHARLGEMLAQREQVAKWYQAELAGCPDLILPGSTSFVYVIQLGEDRTKEDRDRMLMMLRVQDIECAKYFPPIHLQPAYAQYGYKRGDFPITEHVADHTIALPFFTDMTEDQVKTVASALRGAL